MSKLFLERPTARPRWFQIEYKKYAEILNGATNVYPEYDEMMFLLNHMSFST